MKKITSAQMSILLKHTCAKDDNGLPIRVFRGEHGALDPARSGLQTLLGSLSFGTARAASHYAQNPNNLKVKPEAPRVYPAYLVIKNPIINDPHEAFMEFSHLQSKIGFDLATEFFLKNAHWIEHTDNWGNIASEGGFSDVREFHENCPERMSELYTQLWPLLDDPAFIKILKDKGFDGAIYQGSGETLDEPEYRVFDPCSVIYSISHEFQAKSSLDNKHGCNPASP